MEFMELWHRFLALEPQASGELYDKFQPRLHRLLSKLRFSSEQKEDLSQQTWLKVMEASTQFRGQTEAEFAAWILVLCRHSAMDQFRKKTEWAHSDKLDELPHPQAQMHAGQWREWIKMLAEDEQQLVVDVVFMEKSFEELSNEWNQPSSRLRQRFHRLRKKLAGSLS
jgi:RNA polymerase sigma factor (sigma-70 family)